MSQVLQRLQEAARKRWEEVAVEDDLPPQAVEDEANALQLIPVASGKGGVGKTNISVGISIAAGLQFQGTEKRVLLIDGDIGLPNTDLVLGTRPDKTIRDLVEKEIDEIGSLITPTRYPNLDFIAGAEEATLVLGNLYYQQRQKLMGQITSLKSSLVIFDLGASASKETLDFFSMSHSGLLVLNPEPSSIRDGYVFLKNALLRKIRNDIPANGELKTEFDGLLEKYKSDWKRLRDDYPTAASPELQAATNETISRYRPMIVMNRVSHFSEGLTAARQFSNNAEKFLGIKTTYLGPVMQDDAVMRAVRAQRPFRITEPQSQASQCIDSVTRNLLNAEGIDLRRNFASFGRAMAARLSGQPV